MSVICESCVTASLPSPAAAPWGRRSPWRPERWRTGSHPGEASSPGQTQTGGSSECSPRSTEAGWEGGGPGNRGKWGGLEQGNRCGNTHIAWTRRWCFVKGRDSGGTSDCVTVIHMCPDIPVSHSYTHIADIPDVTVHHYSGLLSVNFIQFGKFKSVIVHYKLLCIYSFTN